MLICRANPVIAPGEYPEIDACRRTGAFDPEPQRSLVVVTQPGVARQQCQNVALQHAMVSDVVAPRV
jgi:hypothetical protein